MTRLRFRLIKQTFANLSKQRKGQREILQKKIWICNTSMLAKKTLCKKKTLKKNAFDIFFNYRFFISYQEMNFGHQKS